MTTRTLSLEVLNVLVLCVALSILLRDQFQHIGNSSTTATSPNRQEDHRQLQRRLDTTFDSADATRPFAYSTSGLVSNFSDFVGSWYDCMHTSLTTFEGETEEKEVLHTIGCDHGLLGNITKVRETNEQALKFDFYQLNKCSFHGFGGKGQRPCPNDSLPGREGSAADGKILVKYTFKGLGSFAESDRVQFYADQSYIRSKKGEWKADFERTKSENGDTMVCQKHLEGIVCDWHLNEYRTATVAQSSGCKKDNRCKPGLGKQRCLGMGGEWTDECPRTKYVKEGFLYDSFGSYYLVQNISKCNVQCPDSDDSDE